MHAVVLITTLSLGAPALKDPPKAELKLEGEWVVESQVTNGRPLKLTTERRYAFSADGKWTMYSGNAKAPPPLTRTFTIDDKKKPIAIDMQLSTAAQASAYIGIVKVEGDKLTLCYSRNADERPTAFDSPERSTRVLIVMKRVKKE